jgi:tRNA 2-thiouridine synthesizing protein E
MHAHPPTTAHPSHLAPRAPHHPQGSSPPELAAVLARLEALDAKLDHLTARQRAREELFEDLTPIARDAMARAIAQLDELERDGTLAFGAELVGVARRVIAGFSAEDVRALGDAIVGMLETVRAVTEPGVLAAEPVGMLAFARATRKDEVRKGLGVALEVLRRLGRHAEGAAAPPRALGSKEKLAAMLGPRRARPQLPASTGAPARAATPPPSPPRARAVPPPIPRAAPAAQAPACATPDAAAADPDWTRAKGEATAAAQGVAMTDAHWTIVEVARADFAATTASPNLRRLTQIAAVTTKDLYALFPRAPGRTIAAIAGLPKPAGCL